jgi:8-oxo-dGTP pyrophosphatase MutT (NUDIX family)
MAGDWPNIKARRTTTVSPWMTIIEREVEYREGASPNLYHAVGQQDYVAIVALTPEDQIPIVRQYRPALERFTWELPAGLVDEDESPETCCRRELMEETGLTVARRACARYLRALHRQVYRTGPILSWSQPGRARRRGRRSPA